MTANFRKTILDLAERRRRLALAFSLLKQPLDKATPETDAIESAGPKQQPQPEQAPGRSA